MKNFWWKKTFVTTFYKRNLKYVFIENALSKLPLYNIFINNKIIVMVSIKRGINYLLRNRMQFCDSIVKNFFSWLPDKVYLSLRYRCQMGRWINWRNPKKYQEKLQWLKVYNRQKRCTEMVDKVAVKDYVARIIGEKYIIPTLGVWDSFNEIDFEKLPNQFVLKTNNGGGSMGVVVCTNKSVLDKESAKKQLELSLKGSIYKSYREWPYKDVKPKIFAEAFMEDDSEFNKGGLVDYKFTCFNGKADNVMVCCGRQTGETKFYFFDQAWNLLPLNKRGKETNPNFKLPKPDCMDEMFEIAGKLSEGFPFLRVDLYYINDRPYFGETTFFPASGFDPNILPETEILFGDKILLPNECRGKDNTVVKK